jgi:uncharacterized protein (TIGR02996 family)
VTSRPRIEWTEEARAAVSAQLAKANGRRTSRVLSLEQVARCAEAAVERELGFAWVHGGDAPDVRSLTSVCLCAVNGERLTVSVASAHGAATPADAWSDLPGWDRFVESPNAAACRAWAGRAREDRVSLRLVPAAVPGASVEQLRDAVLADPADDAPRLVLADLLAEQGDPRGELIAVQCELARGGSPREAALRAREQALLSAHGARWVGEGVAGALRVEFRRGFAEVVEVFDAAALPQLEGFFQREPITELVFTSRTGLDGARFANLSWLSRLRALTFRSRGLAQPLMLGRRKLPHLLESARLRALRRLSFVSQSLGDTAVAQLAEHAPAVFPSLQALAVDDDLLTARGVRALVEAKVSSRLLELSLEANALWVEAIEALTLHRRPSQLLSLSLSGNPLGNPGAGALARAGRLGALSRLSLARCRIGPAGAQALLDSELLRGLTTLDLEGNPVGSSMRDRLARRFSPGGPRGA